MQKNANDSTNSLKRHQEKQKPMCNTLIEETDALLDDLDENGVFLSPIPDDFEVEAALTYLEDLHIKSDRVSSRRVGYAPYCNLRTGLCECRSEFSPNSIVELIREKAGELRANLIDEKPINF